MLNSFMSAFLRAQMGHSFYRPTINQNIPRKKKSIVPSYHHDYQNKELQNFLDNYYAKLNRGAAMLCLPKPRKLWKEQMRKFAFYIHSFNQNQNTKEKQRLSLLNTIIRNAIKFLNFSEYFMIIHRQPIA